MIQLLVGWVKDFFTPSVEQKFHLVETVTPAQIIQLETVTPSRRGYNFEHDELKRLMTRLEGFETVRFTDASGNEMTPESIATRFGKDGGIDCAIHIITQTERGARNVATRIRNIIVAGDY
jgi:hypothetical protein